MWPNSKNVRERKPKVLKENKKLLSVTLVSKLNIESEHTSAEKRTTDYHGAPIIRF